MTEGNTTVESIPPGPDSDVSPSCPEVPDPHDPVVTPPPALYWVPQHAISVPSEMAQSAVLLPRVVQLASPATMLTMPQSSGCAQCLLFRLHWKDLRSPPCMLAIGAGRLQDGLHCSVICDDCDMMPVEINMEMLNPQATARIPSSAIP